MGKADSQPTKAWMVVFTHKMAPSITITVQGFRAMSKPSAIRHAKTLVTLQDRWNVKCLEVP